MNEWKQSEKKLQNKMNKNCYAGVKRSVWRNLFVMSSCVKWSHAAKPLTVEMISCYPQLISSSSSLFYRLIKRVHTRVISAKAHSKIINCNRHWDWYKPKWYKIKKIHENRQTKINEIWSDLKWKRSIKNVQSKTFCECIREINRERENKWESVRQGSRNFFVHFIKQTLSNLRLSLSLFHYLHIMHTF